jgi:hypothetical protein
MMQRVLSNASRVRLARTTWLAGLLAAAALLGGCATHYVDGTTKEVLPAQMAKPAQPKPVQLLVEFQTKGVANARATEHTRRMMTDDVQASGLFAEVKDTPVPGGRVLSITLNNVPLTDDAAARGFITGLTFGAAGNQVTDGYICTVSYLAPGASQPVVKSARHAIHTTLGAKDAPPNAYKAAGIEDAVRTMIRQVLSVALDELSRDPGFR